MYYQWMDYTVVDSDIKYWRLPVDGKAGIWSTKAKTFAKNMFSADDHARECEWGDPNSEYFGLKNSKYNS